jgi:hypothetical protein
MREVDRRRQRLQGRAHFAAGQRIFHFARAEAVDRHGAIEHGAVARARTDDGDLVDGGRAGIRGQIAGFLRLGLAGEQQCHGECAASQRRKV